MKTTLALLTVTLAATATYAQFPLRVDINASASTEQLNIGAGQDGEATVERVTVGVTIKKDSGQPWDHPVKAELYVLGTPVNMDAFTVVGKTEKEFKFTKDNDHTIEFESPVYAFGETSGNINVGLEYETYLVIVIDHEGKAVDTRCGRSLNEKEMKLIRTLEINKIYDKDLNIVGSVDQLNQATKRAVPAATDPGDNY